MACDLFLRRGRIVSTRGREGVEIKTEEASGTAPYPDLPLVVLVNQHTASAAEIVAACLQDHGRAIVVGQRTYGKGTVQNVIRLEGGHSLLKLTTASYWRPSGQDIHRYPDVKDQQHWGVQPNEDYEVALDEAATSELIRRRHQHPTLSAPPRKTRSAEAGRARNPMVRFATRQGHRGAGNAAGGLAVRRRQPPRLSLALSQAARWNGPDSNFIVARGAIRFCVRFYLAIANFFASTAKTAGHRKTIARRRKKALSLYAT